MQRYVLDGDRLAGQGDFQSALEKYTKAYMGIVSSIRGQSFSKEVAVAVFNREQLGQEMLRMMRDEFTPEELDLMESSFKVLGLVEPELNCQELFTKMLTEEVAGFYDPDTKRMVLIVEDGPVEDPGWFSRFLGAKPAFDKAEQKTTLAHELTHALQDQLYDLNRMEEAIEGDDDMLLAFSGIVEGDATLLMMAESQDEEITDMDPATMRATFRMMSWMMPLAGGETFRSAPAIFRESLMFPYVQGMLFVIEQANEQGWPSVHSLYARPPQSSEQILHPEKYRQGAQYDAPQAVNLPDCLQLLGDQWNLLGKNCLGEFQTGVLLRRVPGGNRAARGWDGDSYQVYKNREGHLGLAMLTIWDSEQDAREFAEAYCRYRGRQFEDAQAIAFSAPTDARPENWLASKGDLRKSPIFASEAQSLVALGKEQVAIVEGFDEALCAKLFNKIVSTATFSTKIAVGSSQQAAP
ncbi:MAG: hypothetical protein KDB22_17060 [Planctomycetales bacterium]|nr:hypothetical protein [Planctomycetales bacterium]